MVFPEIGLGPLVRAQADAVYVRDLERDFTLDKVSGTGTLICRPGREFQVSLRPDLEDNDMHLFQFNSISEYLDCSGQGNTALASLLRVPDGESFVVGAAPQRRLGPARQRVQRAQGHVRRFWAGSRSTPSPRAPPSSRTRAASHARPRPTGQPPPPPSTAQALPPAPQAAAHFVRLTQTFAGYLPIYKNISFAAELRLGENLKTAQCQYTTPINPESPPQPYCTYPDRLFFMGGFDSMRGWLQDTFMPQEYANQIKANPALCQSSSTNCLIPLRGGNLMVNPRVELRFPIRAPINAAIFADFGNLYLDPATSSSTRSRCARTSARGSASRRRWGRSSSTTAST